MVNGKCKSKSKSKVMFCSVLYVCIMYECMYVYPRVCLIWPRFWSQKCWGSKNFLMACSIKPSIFPNALATGSTRQTLMFWMSGQVSFLQSSHPSSVCSCVFNSGFAHISWYTPKPPRIDPCVLGNRRVSPQVHKEQPANNRWNPLRKWLKHPAPFSITAPLHVSNFCA